MGYMVSIKKIIHLCPISKIMRGGINVIVLVNILLNDLQILFYIFYISINKKLMKLFKIKQIWVSGCNPEMIADIVISLWLTYLTKKKN